MPELDARHEKGRAYGRAEANARWSQFELALKDLAGEALVGWVQTLVKTRERCRALVNTLEELKCQRRGGLKSAAFYRDLKRKHPQIGRKQDLVEAQRWLVATRRERAKTYQELAQLQALEAQLLNQRPKDLSAP